MKLRSFPLCAPWHQRPCGFCTMLCWWFWCLLSPRSVGPHSVSGPTPPLCPLKRHVDTLSASCCFSHLLLSRFLLSSRLSLLVVFLFLLCLFELSTGEDHLLESKKPMCLRRPRDCCNDFFAQTGAALTNCSVLASRTERQDPISFSTFRAHRAIETDMSCFPTSKASDFTDVHGA